MNKKFSELKSSLKKSNNQQKNIEHKNFSINNKKQININDKCEIIDTKGNVYINQLNFEVNNVIFKKNRNIKTLNEFIYAKNFYEKNVNNNQNLYTNNKIEEDTIKNTHKNILIGKNRIR
jgi:hypothetical protein